MKASYAAGGGCEGGAGVGCCKCGYGGLMAILSAAARQ